MELENFYFVVSDIKESAKFYSNLFLKQPSNITKERWADWENGRSMSDLSLLEDLCNELDINELLTEEEIKASDYITRVEENLINLKKNIRVFFLS